MTNEVESELKKILLKAAEKGINDPVSVKLNSGIIFDGFKILEHNEKQKYILGFSNEQRTDSAKDNEFYQATIIKTDKISNLYSPSLNINIDSEAM